MRLGYVSLPVRGANDLFLSDIAQVLQAQLRLCGAVQANTTRTDRRKCDMDLKLLPAGKVLRISEDPDAQSSDRRRSGRRHGVARFGDPAFP